MKKFFVKVNFYNPSSCEMDWCIVGKNNKETLSEELAMMFDSYDEAQAWTESNEAKEWTPCSFSIQQQE